MGWKHRIALFLDAQQNIYSLPEPASCTVAHASGRTSNQSGRRKERNKQTNNQTNKQQTTKVAGGLSCLAKDSIRLQVCVYTTLPQNSAPQRQLIAGPRGGRQRWKDKRGPEHSHHRCPRVLDGTVILLAFKAAASRFPQLHLSYCFVLLLVLVRESIAKHRIAASSPLRRASSTINSSSPRIILRADSTFARLLESCAQAILLTFQLQRPALNKPQMAPTLMEALLSKRQFYGGKYVCQLGTGGRVHRRLPPPLVVLVLQLANTSF